MEEVEGGDNEDEEDVISDEEVQQMVINAGFIN